MSFFLYILKSQFADKYYTGISEFPLRRLDYHNSIEKGFTSRYRPWKIIFTKEFPDKISALNAEMKIKKWKSKKMIELHIDGKISL